jgi:hypothetical protein
MVESGNCGIAAGRSQLPDYSITEFLPDFSRFRVLTFDG